jgi:hypothetical protein
MSGTTLNFSIPLRIQSNTVSLEKPSMHDRHVAPILIITSMMMEQVKTITSYPFTCTTPKLKSTPLIGKLAETVPF